MFFYGLYALVGEALNARRIFGPFAWAPIVNNLVSIVGFVLLILLFGTELTDVSMWTPDAIALLGGTATLGIVAQAVVLLLFWKRTGLSLRPDFRWRGVGLAQTGKLAGWTFLMVIAGQLAGLVQTRIANLASGEGVSVFAMQQAWLLYMLPYSLIVLSIGTPYFTQLSEHAHAGRKDEVKNDIERSIRALGFFLAVAVAAMAAASVPASRVFTNNASEAEALAPVLLCYLLALWPLSVLFIVQRTFYAYGDTRTPFFFTLFQCALVVATALGAGALATAEILPLEYLAVTIAFGQALASIAQTVAASLLLRRRIGSIRSRAWMPSLLRFAVAAAPAGLAGWGAYLLLSGPDGWMTADKLFGAVGSGVIALVVLAVYIGIMALMRVPELSAATEIMRRFLPRR
ncbi:murein biosynthesis integral membrane protein MurJ [Microbacterium sp. NIBRBAC000506063]|uniref:murein biosynthesis integral membrane protein MurJ n=1 Tax=Microbacterium sp. NIBRBAC000506063 TaxID=2734618 RepID=UPI0021D45F26|nr:lipid II flippase MurJ [Microbacterium sp. NIBRBAC000506063]